MLTKEPGNYPSNSQGMSSELINKAANYIKIKTFGEPTGHDWFHTERVWKIASHIQSKEGGDLEKIELLALLHDIGDTINYELEKQKGPLVLRGMMDILDIPKQQQDELIKIILEIKYKGDDHVPPISLEAKIVQDADFLDSLGAVGIARIFATGGSIKRMIYNPAQKPRKKLTREDNIYRKQDGTSVNYFYEKTLRLPAIINTATAKKIALERAQFTEDFIKQFLKDWQGKN